MKKVLGLVLVVVVVVLGGGAVFLATWDIPPPTRTFENTIPNDRFPR